MLMQGTVMFTGCVFNAVGGMYQSSGIGYLSFCSAGLTIFTVRDSNNEGAHTMTTNGIH